MRKRRELTLRFFYFVFDQRYDKIADGLVLRSRQCLQLGFQREIFSHNGIRRKRERGRKEGGL